MTGRNQQMNFFCIFILIIMAIVFVGTTWFSSVLNPIVMMTTTTSTPKPPLVNFDDVKIDPYHHLRQRVIANKLSLANKQIDKNWQKKIQEFLKRVSPYYQNRTICADYWAVVVEYAENILETAKRLPNWCFTVVFEGNEETPNRPDNMFVLNGAIQQELAQISAFFKESLLLPKGLNPIQKNLGYLWAIFHEAKIIYDFDSVNELLVNETVLSFMFNETIEGITVANHTNPLFNPYSLFKTEFNLIWSRGFPYHDFEYTKTTHSVVETLQGVWPKKNIALVHSLIEGYANLGHATYRLVRPKLPILCKNGTNNATTDTRVIVPRRTFSPYDQQATFHFQQGLWGLYLPVTIHPMIADVIRSYIMQRLMWNTNLQISFVGSFFFTKYTDPEAREVTLLYRKSEQTRQIEKSQFWALNKLVLFLSQWLAKPTDFMERAEQLFFALHEHGYIKLYDVYLFQLWLKELHNIGYIFPEYTP